jgi:hypothetical protein
LVIGAVGWILAEHDTKVALFTVAFRVLLSRGFVRMFNYDPAAARDEFKQNGYVHLRGVLKPSVVEHLSDFLDQAKRENVDEQGQWRIYGKKRQFLFDFPNSEWAEEFRHAMAAMIGIEPQDLTISERHLKVYEPDAEPWPAPHKDRAASEISIGLPIAIPENSSACVFPALHPGPNTEDRAVFLTDRALPGSDEVYRTEECVMLNEQPGDIVAFLGSALYHERVHPAGAAILYIKVNGTGSDPLGENIYHRAELA